MFYICFCQIHGSTFLNLYTITELQKRIVRWSRLPIVHFFYLWDSLKHKPSETSEGAAFPMLWKKRLSVNHSWPPSSWFKKRHKGIIGSSHKGSVIGPVLFVIYVNDLSDRLSADSLLYADDVKLIALRNRHDIPSKLPKHQRQLVQRLGSGPQPHQKRAPSHW